MSYAGTKGPLLTSQEAEFSRGQGWSDTVTYTGGRDEVFGIADELIFDGYEFDITQDGPYYTLTGRRQAQNVNNQSFVDRYKFSKESIDREIWTLEAVQSEANNYGDIQDYKKIIEDALEDGDETAMTLSLPPANYPAAWKTLTELARGATHYEDEYIVLARERVVGIKYTPKLDLKNTSYIYTTAQLISVFGIPNFSNVFLPDAPSYIPPQTQWGWRSRNEQINFLEGQKAEISQDWVYAAWSTNLYDTF